MATAIKTIRNTSSKDQCWIASTAFTKFIYWKAYCSDTIYINILYFEEILQYDEKKGSFENIHLLSKQIKRSIKNISTNVYFLSDVLYFYLLWLLSNDDFLHLFIVVFWTSFFDWEKRTLPCPFIGKEKNIFFSFLSLHTYPPWIGWFNSKQCFINTYLWFKFDENHFYLLNIKKIPISLSSSIKGVNAE